MVAPLKNAGFSAVLNGEYVKIGRDTWVPRHVAFTGEGTQGEPDVRIDLEVVDGVPRVTRFELTAREGGRGIRTADLRAFHSLDAFTVNAFKSFALVSQPASYPDQPPLNATRHATTPADLQAVIRDLDRAAPGRRGVTIEELENVAKVYRDAVGENPTAAVQRTFNYSTRTAARRVQQARARGLLPETTQGKKRA